MAVHYIYVELPENRIREVNSLLPNIELEHKIKVAGRRVERRSFGRIEFGLVKLIPRIDHRYGESGAWTKEAFEGVDKKILKGDPDVNYVISVWGVDEKDAQKNAREVTRLLRKEGVSIYIE